MYLQVLRYTPLHFDTDLFLEPLTLIACALITQSHTGVISAAKLVVLEKKSRKYVKAGAALA